MGDYVSVQWFLDTNCRLKRNHDSYTEEFSVLNAEVPVIKAVPVKDLQPILKALQLLGGHEELIAQLIYLMEQN